MPNSASSDLRDTPTPSSYALACPGSCGMFKASVLGVLGCDVRLAVASQPMRHPGSGSGSSYLTCAPQRLETSRLERNRDVSKRWGELLGTRVPEGVEE